MPSEKNCHPKIEQLKNCQLKIHTLEVFAVFILSIASLSEEYGKIGLCRISHLTEIDRGVFEIVFLDECNVSHVLCRS
jgi:hypothetical protein